MHTDYLAEIPIRYHCLVIPGRSASLRKNPVPLTRTGFRCRLPFTGRGLAHFPGVFAHLSPSVWLWPCMFLGKLCLSPPLPVNGLNGNRSQGTVLIGSRNYRVFPVLPGGARKAGSGSPLRW